MSAQKEVDALFKDLDSLPTGVPIPGKRASAHLGATGTSPADTSAIQALAELDTLAKTDTPAITTKPRLGAGSSISRPSSRATERVSLSSLKARNTSVGSTAESQAATAPRNESAAAPTPSSSSSSGWGWGSVWNSASAAIQQAKTAVDEGVKNLPANIPKNMPTLANLPNLPNLPNIPNIPQPNAEQTKQWREGLMGYVKNAQLDKISQDLKAVSLSTFNDIMNAVAPPIAEHEVIQVWLSHDLEGYDGVETLVYRALARILEQVEGGDLIVNKGNESRPKDRSEHVERDLNEVEGFDAALKLAVANIDDLDKPGTKSSSTTEHKPTTTDLLTNPTTYTIAYLRIQPFISPSPFNASSTSSTDISQIQFLLHLRDPSHLISISTLTQAMPARWMDLWEKHEWVEDQLAESLRLGVEVLGQEYVVQRMGWDKEEEEGEEVEEGQRGRSGSGERTEDTDGEFEKVDAHAH